MVLERGWLGPAPRTWNGRLIDGQRRIAIAGALGFAVPPSIEVGSASAAARWLALQGHDDRALAMAENHLGGELPALLPAEVRARLEGHRRAEHKRNAKRRLDAQRRNRNDRTHAVITRLRAAVQRAEQTGQPCSAAELREILGTCEVGK